MLLAGHREDGNMRHTSLTLVGIAAAVVSISPPGATMRITGDPGGMVVDYVERFEAARASGDPVIIDGACPSACTLAVGILPRGQVCATPNAVLGFHAAWRPTANGGRVTSPDVTHANVRKWIARRGGLSGRLILLKGRELAVTHVKPPARCSSARSTWASMPTTSPAARQLPDQPTILWVEPPSTGVTRHCTQP
jgi:hypothetical protein